MPNISRSKNNQTMKLGKLIECNIRNTKCGRETSPIPFSWKLKLAIYLYLDQKPKILHSLFLLNPKLMAIEMYWNSAGDYSVKRSISPYPVEMQEMRTRITLNMDTFYPVDRLLLPHIKIISKNKKRCGTSLPASFPA